MADNLTVDDLLAAIVAQWGPFSPHATLFRSMTDMINSLRRDCARLTGEAVLERALADDLALVARLLLLLDGYERSPVGPDITDLTNALERHRQHRLRSE